MTRQLLEDTRLAFVAGSGERYRVDVVPMMRMLAVLGEDPGGL
jgi:hypothetical protein